jgi:hypothetical protein
MIWQEWTILADNEALWLDYEEPGLCEAEYLHDYVLRLSFADEPEVSIFDLDLAPLFVDQNPGGVFQALAEKRRFRFVRGEYALIWPNPESGDYDETAIDLAPECVRYFCDKYGQPVTASRLRLLEHFAQFQKV